MDLPSGEKPMWPRVTRGTSMSRKRPVSTPHSRMKSVPRVARVEPSGESAEQRAPRPSRSGRLRRLPVATSQRRMPGSPHQPLTASVLPSGESAKQSAQWGQGSFSVQRWTRLPVVRSVNWRRCSAIYSGSFV
jgi:hypothetical protein